MISRFDQASAAQRRALNPAESVWVSASAGTGKTKVLTDRLLALMLDGADPSRILCLTFTRAAAAEMANRLNRRLSAWTILPPGALELELVELTGRFPDEYDIAQARRLFAQVLDVPGGAKIATIHAFCQSLLSRFPLEAGVPPEFTVIDERSASEALAEATETVINAARADPKGRLASALTIVARHAPEDRFLQFMAQLAGERGKLQNALADGEAALRARLCRHTVVSEDATRDGLIAAFCAAGACDERGLRTAAAALVGGGKSDRPRGAGIARWCDEGPAGRPDLIEEYSRAFLTNEGEIRKSLIGKEAMKLAPLDAPAVLAAEAQRIERFRSELGGVEIVEATVALVRLGAALLRAYERHKRLRGLLDYDDLVLKALDLLRRPGVAPWVLFKLDGGLDHILIDEAQDTNPEQWAIVTALAEEFFVAEDDERRRSIFAVGDAKQSIYSFQRADPRAFVDMRRHFETRVTEARRRWAEVPLEISFRASEPLLHAVDAVFRQMDAADGVALDGIAINHIAARAGQAGLVELWPPVPADTGDPDAEGEADIRRRPPEPRTRLARAIAATIACWLKNGERLEPRGRALRAGDVLVLVRRRNAFVGDLLRALKDEGVPVAGADRLALVQEMAVRDLMALGHFLLLPEDDLTLATVLKGPLFGFSEEALFLLAYDRGETRLWPRLRRLARDDLVMAEAVERLQHLLARADFVPPFELYSEILEAGGGRRALLERLGPEAADPIDEFLALALQYEREHVPSLQGFLRWLAAGDIEVKRDFGERQRDEVRIMTVHGAKGLEAPVVFLPDTLQLPDRGGQLLWAEDDGLPLWRPRGDIAAPAYVAERRKQRRLQLQEYRRLLYVALTRAQDRLYVCGWQTQRPTREAPCWHALCAAGWEPIAEKSAFDARPLLGERLGWCGEALRLRSEQTAPPNAREAVALGAAAPPAGALPEWATRPPPPEPNPPKPLLPSRPSGPEPATLSPLAIAGRDRFKRGLLVHRLLQSLPELPAAEREAAAVRFLALPVHGLPPAEQAEIAAETLAVLSDPELADLWGPHSRAEVPVVGLIGGAKPGTDAHALSGQIDRLVVTPDRVVIIDYKTIRPPPESEDEVAPAYLQQLATYQAALGRIYGDRPVDCAILWTDGPRLMPISPDLLARHLPGRLQP